MINGANGTTFEKDHSISSEVDRRSEDNQGACNNTQPKWRRIMKWRKKKFHLRILNIHNFPNLDFQIARQNLAGNNSIEMTPKQWKQLSEITNSSALENDTTRQIKAEL
jgi:hypothetical protein